MRNYAHIWGLSLRSICLDVIGFVCHCNDNLWLLWKENVEKKDIEYICRKGIQHHLVHKIRILLREQRLRQHHVIFYISSNHGVN